MDRESWCDVRERAARTLLCAGMVTFLGAVAYSWWSYPRPPPDDDPDYSPETVWVERVLHAGHRYPTLESYLAATPAYERNVEGSGKAGIVLLGAGALAWAYAAAKDENL